MIEPVPEEFKDNGCGPKQFGWLIPDGPFRPCCRQHDWEYHLGGTEEDRKLADKEFLRCMLSRSKWYQKPRAYLYYAAVRSFGHPSFTYRPERYPSQAASQLET